jgi:hydroxymethylpyrimidine pyrophosphatase-like HAD family hydrolase
VGKEKGHLVMAVLAIDFDHTLVDGDKLRPFAREAINILREKGHKIVIHSCNNWKWIEKVLDNSDVRYDHIWTGEGKPLADLYVDDKGYHYRGDWESEVNDILLRVEGLDNRKW